MKTSDLSIPSSPSADPSSPVRIHSVLKKQKVDYDSLHETKVGIHGESDGESGGESGGESDGESGGESDGESHLSDFACKYMATEEANYTKYITQVEASDGFDLDHTPKIRCFGLVTPVRLDKISGCDDYPTFGDFMKHFCICALNEYNKDKEEQLVFDRVEKATSQLEIGPVFRITFFVKDASSQSKVFQAKVGYLSGEIDVKFCRPKP